MDSVNVPPDELPIGCLVEIHGPVMDTACDTLPPQHQAFLAYSAGEVYPLETFRYLDPGHVRAITLRSSAGLRRGVHVYDSGGGLRIPVSEECLGRLLDVFGTPLDGEPALKTEQFRPDSTTLRWGGYEAAPGSGFPRPA